MEEIAPKVYIENRFLGPTVGAFFLPHGTVLVDAPPLPDETRSWRASVANMGSGLDRLLVYLDAHPDRTLGGYLMEIPPIIQEEGARQFRKRSALFKNQPLHLGAAWEMAAPLSGVRWRHPMFTFSDTLSIYLREEPLILAHRPGPAPGASWLIDPLHKLVFVGDAVVQDEPPFFHQADIPLWLETLQRLLTEHADYLVISSRGGAIPVQTIHLHMEVLTEVHQQLQVLAKRRAPVEATTALLPSILSYYDYPADYQTLFETRLRSGLAMLYTRRYHTTTPHSENEA